VLAVLAVTWTLNLFNFMDGIDGIAGSEAVFIAAAGAILVAVGGGSAAVPSACLVVAAACLGFLRWNWPPASIFMGDVGSGYLGYIFAALALAAARNSAVMLNVWLILGGVFFVDATVTLLRRFARRERVFDAHRTHAYQWLARSYRSHRRVTILVSIVNLVWLLPWACIALLSPVHAGWSVAAALIPLAIAGAFVGAGRREPN
jgi:Fuc2NAc and GlcNAc transferase